MFSDIFFNKIWCKQLGKEGCTRVDDVKISWNFRVLSFSARSV